MFTQPTPSPATETLRKITLLLDVFAQDVELCDLSTLDRIAATASQMAQDLRLKEDMDMGSVDEWEAFLADKMMAESDALDHQVAR